VARQNTMQEHLIEKTVASWQQSKERERERDWSSIIPFKVTPLKT
jgi:hypothetical protein